MLLGMHFRFRVCGNIFGRPLDAGGMYSARVGGGHMKSCVNKRNQAIVRACAVMRAGSLVCMVASENGVRGGARCGT